MIKPNISFDHVHVISPDPKATADWYVEKLEGLVQRSVEIKGAPQIYVEFTGGAIIIRGERDGETAEKKAELAWGTDHFGFRVEGDFDNFCRDLKEKGVRFTVEPFDFNSTTRIAFIEDPDGVKIELLQKK